jgi:hypothetical protein
MEEGPPPGAVLRRVAVLFVLAVSCSGCASGGLGLDRLGVDETLVTASIVREGAARPDAERLSDEETIRNAVSSANLERLTSGSIPWANSSTGSRGEIAAIVERVEDGRLCRRFTVSRESFQGVALFRGEACLAAGGWSMSAFDEA